MTVTQFLFLIGVGLFVAAWKFPKVRLWLGALAAGLVGYASDGLLQFSQMLQGMF